ncbi:hypothetical protein LX36DRAFT_750370 [Colletotrichum falcatum]|nr:hypothetical protein LX36DRAFT_750370 [Colletotrichum falcatum]
MRGRTLEFSFGLMNQVKSVTRRVLKTAKRNTPGSFTGCRPRPNVWSDAAFGPKGESAACVFGLAGRAVGMATGGTSRDDGLRPGGPSAKSPRPPEFCSYMHQLCGQPGARIASLDRTASEGAKGLYLRRVGGDPSQVFALARLP